MAPATTSASGILTYITPSPGMEPVPVTEQSQLVSSFAPLFTLCELPPKAIFPLTSRPTTIASTALWSNVSVSIPTGSGTCTTIYEPTVTMVCATTLTGLVQKYTVSRCSQDITFSTEYGFVLAKPTESIDLSAVGASSSAATPAPTTFANVSAVATSSAPAITAAPTVQRLTTYFLAPWQAVTAGEAPTEVALKVCAGYANGTTECIRQYEVWQTALLTESATRTTSVNISTTLHGLSQIIIETFAANITEAMTTFRMTTDLELEFMTEYTTTRREAVAPSTASSTNQITRTLLNASSSRSAAVTSTRTSTIRRTTTVYMDTPTTAAAAPVDAEGPAMVTVDPEVPNALPTPTHSVDWAAELGIEMKSA
ncbi:unnamed protein product [Zymoseptoria tritici ST99CH_1A5]|uniref:Uncharacterized protein n=1 Tax=Zymoseptoria tritici ST99CH_1A5 TaxID=1276529 RepID=A0A1Y6M265_ZYMTR|nr:unnamed protein product [Zymoseptoria tritici ST99CH_1A5]